MNPLPNSSVSAASRQSQSARPALPATQAFPADLQRATEALEQVAAAVRLDALTASNEYLAASQVPHGGE